MPEAQEGCGAVGVEDVPEGEGVVPLQDPDVVVAGVEDLEDVRIDQHVAEKGEIKALRQRIDQPGPLPGLDLEEAELFPEVAEGIVFRIEGDDRGGADRLFGLRKLCRRVDERPGFFHDTPNSFAPV